MLGTNSGYNSFRTSFRMQPIALRNIIIVTIFSYLIQQVYSGWITHLAYFPGLYSVATQPWRIVTYLFLHNDIWHILFNMLWLYWMGRQVELDLGPRNFSAIYFLSGMGGALLNLLFAGMVGANPVIGASGAVYGIMVSYAVLYPNTPIMLFLLPPLPAKYVITGLIFIDVVLIGQKSAIARLVHVGGALTGYVLIRLYKQGKSLSGWIDFLMYYVNRIQHQFASAKVKQPKKARNPNMRAVEDAEIIIEVDQNELDRILDKIAKTGYEGLTKEEKRILFEMSKRK